MNQDDKIKYGNMKKVYSIWICMDCPKYARNTITSYDIRPTNLYGNFKGKARYDLMSVVMVCLNDNTEEKETSELIKMLTILLANKLEFEQKKQLLEEMNIPMTNQLGEEISGMCNLSKGVMEQGIQQGALTSLISLVKKGLLTVEVAAKELGISVEEFEKKMSQ